MKKLAHLALAAALMASSAVGAATLIPTSASAAAAMEEPWAVITYIRGGQPVGYTELYCSSPDVSWGDTTNYDYSVWTTYSMCP